MNLLGGPIKRKRMTKDNPWDRVDMLEYMYGEEFLYKIYEPANVEFFNVIHWCEEEIRERL